MADIKIKDLVYYYPGTDGPALVNIDLEIPAGQFVLVVGGSGSGKSSLIRAISGLIPEFYGGTYGGKVYLDGKEVRKLDRRTLVQRVGTVFQDPESQLVMTTVEEELAFGLENLGLPNGLMKRRVLEAAAAMGLTTYLHSYIPELSGGVKQKVALGAVLTMQPEILALDEPTSQLDPVASEEILAAIKRLNEENGITVILVEQRLERCFHLADRVIVMDGGRIVSDRLDPGEMARWAVSNGSPFVPPLARLFAEVGYPEVPLTVKEGRKLLLSAFSPPELRSAYQESCWTNGGEKRAGTAPGAEAETLVAIENLWFTYPNGTEALKGIDLTVRAGDFIAILGENAAGKTTLLKIIRGLLQPGRGQVKVLNRVVGKTAVEELAGWVGYLPQNPDDYLFMPTVKEELEFTRKNLGLPADGTGDKILEQLGLTPYKDRNPRDLSLGERRRVALASVLVGKPRILLLDEPTRGLDYQLKYDLGNILCELQAQGAAILVVTHDIEFAAEFAQHIILLADGSIVACGDKHEVLAGSTFYSPQIGRLFSRIVDQVVTFAEGREVLNSALALRKGRVRFG